MTLNFEAKTNDLVWVPDLEGAVKHLVAWEAGILEIVRALEHVEAGGIDPPISSVYKPPTLAPDDLATFRRKLLNQLNFTRQAESIVQQSGVYVYNGRLDDDGIPDRYPEWWYEHMEEDEEPDSITVQIDNAHRDLILGIALGDHSEALHILNDYGYAGLDAVGRPPTSSTILRLPTVEGIFWPSHFWDEVVALKRAHWIHQKLREDPDSLEEFFVAKASESHIGKILWPEHLTLSWSLQDSRMIYDTGNLVVFFWHVLADMLNDGTNRHPTQDVIVFDEESRAIRAARRTSTFFGSVWEQLRLDVMQESLPIQCATCGYPVVARRSTRKYCDRAACRKAAQRAKQRSKEVQDGA